MFTEAPYIYALKEEYLTSHCSSCFKESSFKCPQCKVMINVEKMIVFLIKSNVKFIKMI
jgi:hypothetical protein